MSCWVNNSVGVVVLDSSVTCCTVNKGLSEVNGKGGGMPAVELEGDEELDSLVMIIGCDRSVT